MSKYDADNIIELLENPDTDLWMTQRELSRRAQSIELIAALKIATSSTTRFLLCHTLGQRCDTEAVPVLIDSLYDRDAGVRTEAAEALGNIGDMRAGPALLERFIDVDEIGSKNLIVYALGAVGYRPAIPALIQAFNNSDRVLPSSIALSLGALGAVEVRDTIQRALDLETELYPKKLLQRALSAIELVANALDSKDHHVALPILVKALNTSDPLLSEAAAWALGVIGNKEIETALHAALTRQKNKCGRAQRIKEALAAIGARD